MREYYCFERLEDLTREIGRRLVPRVLPLSLAVCLYDVFLVICSTSLEFIDKTPVNTRPCNGGKDAQVMPRPTRPVKAVERQIGLAHQRRPYTFETVG